MENVVLVSGIITFIAAVHYFYMRDVWVETGATPLVYRYIDWLITVPLLMVEFYLILRELGMKMMDRMEADDWYVCHVGRRLYG